ncbi:TPA: glycosyltransferase [Photobacterium damselae]
MKIGFFLRDFKFEGVQIVVARLVNELISKGHDCELITLTDNANIILNHDVKCHSLNINEKFSYKQAIKHVNKFNCLLLELEKEKKFDVIFSVHGETNDIISYIDNNRLVYCIHNSDETSYYKKNIINRFRFKRKLAKKIQNKHVICVSDGIKTFIENNIDQRYISLTRIYNPFNFKEILESANQEIVEELPEKYIIFVGRLEKQKNIFLLLHSLFYIENDISLIIMGEGSLEDSIRKEIIKLKLSDRVVILPFTDNPYMYIKKAKALVLTSSHEGFGNVLVESLICGTPAISTNCPSGPSEILTGELSHHLVNSYNPKVIGNVITKIIGERRKIYTNNIENFSSNTIADEYINYINKIRSH